jgi:NADPH:quinone reductase-like Zn-dependent oxidoreductase
MRAVQLDRAGGPSVLQVRKVAVPVPRRGEVLVRVRAAGVNPTDVMRRRLRVGRLPRGTGVDFAGEVAGAGPGAGDLEPGTLVWGYLGGGMPATGTMADYVVVRRSRLAPAPTTIDLVTAAAVPVVGLTAVQALRDAVRLRAGERLLVVGASGGVGSLTVQLGRALGARVTAVSSRHNFDFCRELGADRVLDYAAIAHASRRNASRGDESRGESRDDESRDAARGDEFRGGESRGDEFRGDESRGDEFRGDAVRDDAARGDEFRDDAARGDEFRDDAARDDAVLGYAARGDGAWSDSVRGDAVLADVPRDIDVLVDCHGGDLRRYRALLRPGGRAATVAAAGFAYAAGSWLLPGPSVRMVFVRPRAADLDILAAHIDAGRIRPIVEAIYPLEAVQDAHRAVESGHARGKRVIDLSR